LVADRWLLTTNDPQSTTNPSGGLGKPRILDDNGPLEKGVGQRPGHVRRVLYTNRGEIMNPKYRPLLLYIGMVLGGILAVWVWFNFARFGIWTFLGIVLAVWFAMGAVSLILLRRQNRRK
jgi:hypothetical protein